LPWQLAERLGFRPGAWPGDWVAALFHLWWHFPLPGIGVDRYRILEPAGEGGGAFLCRELDHQLGAAEGVHELFHGVTVSRLGDAPDFLAASMGALRLILKALDGTGRTGGPQPSAEFALLHAEFDRLARAHAGYTRGLSVRVLRLADPSRTRPATEWAGVRLGRDGCGTPDYLVLSHLGTDRVVCEIRGPEAEAFRRLADRAGRLLPTWPARQYPAVLSDVGAFARFCDTTRYPWTCQSGYAWNRGMVTGC
jgi:hypothetical protein